MWLEYAFMYIAWHNIDLFSTATAILNVNYSIKTQIEYLNFSAYERRVCVSVVSDKHNLIMYVDSEKHVTENGYHVNWAHYVCI